MCIGCKACEVACKQWNQLPSDGFNFTGNSYDNTNQLGAESWRHVKFVEQFGDVTPHTPGPMAASSQSSKISLDLAPHESEGAGPVADDVRRMQALRGRALPAGVPDGRDHHQRVCQYLHPAGHL